MIIDWLSNAYIGHPLVQTIVSVAGKAFGLCLFLAMVWACLFLGFFGKNRRYTFPRRSLSEKFWQATWLLQIIVILFLVRGFYRDEYDVSVGEIVLFSSPYVLMIASFILAGRYYQTTGKALQEEAERGNHGKHSIGADRAADNRRI